MKKSLFVACSLLAACGLIACEGGDEKKQESKTNSDGKTDADNVVDDFEAYCLKNANFTGCIKNSSGQTGILVCANGAYVRVEPCQEHSTCVGKGESLTCECDKGYDLTNDSSGTAYICKAQLPIPEEIQAICKDKADGYTSCENAANNDVWAVYCSGGKVYGGNSDNCSALGLECGDKKYDNGTFKECVECTSKAQCTLITSSQHLTNVCDNGVCGKACETGWKDDAWADPDSLDGRCTVEILHSCDSNSECDALIAEEHIEGKYGLCGSTNKECEFYCHDDYSYVWDQDALLGKISCKKKTEN